MLKRLFDIVIAAIALLLLSPVLAALAVIVRIRLGTPVLHVADRPGLHGYLFKMVKFRSMTTETDASGLLLSDELRTTAFGAWLRRTSLDELPELWNVLIGDMSLVGPRPLLPQYLPLYSPVQARRHLVRPGMTGWAQINGRNGIPWDDKFALDVWYVDNRSFLLDLRIIRRTVSIIMKQDNISAPDHVTMPPFLGSALRQVSTTETHGVGGNASIAAGDQPRHTAALANKANIDGV